MFAVRFARWRALHLCRYAKAKKGEERLCSCWHDQQLKWTNADEWNWHVKMLNKMQCSIDFQTDTSPRSRWRRKQVLDRVIAFMLTFMFLQWWKKWANKLFQWTFVREIRMRNVMRIGHMWIRSYYVYVHICGLWIHDTIRSMLLHVGFLASLLSGLPWSPLL